MKIFIFHSFTIGIGTRFVCNVRFLLLRLVWLGVRIMAPNEQDVDDADADDDEVIIETSRSIMMFFINLFEFQSNKKKQKKNN